MNERLNEWMPGSWQVVETIDSVEESAIPLMQEINTYITVYILHIYEYTIACYHSK